MLELRLRVRSGRPLDLIALLYQHPLLALINQTAIEGVLIGV